MFSKCDYLDVRRRRFGVLVGIVGLLAGVVVVPALGDALADCNEAERPAARIAGCTAIIEAGPSSDVLGVALMNRGIGHAAEGDFDLALADFDAALEAAPGMVEGYYNRGNVNLDLGRNEAAIKDFTIVIDAEPRFALGWLNRGLAREQKGDKVGAKRDIERALALNGSLDAGRRALARLKRVR